MRKTWQDLQAAVKKKESHHRKEIVMKRGGSFPKDLSEIEHKVSDFSFRNYAIQFDRSSWNKIYAFGLI